MPELTANVDIAYAVSEDSSLKIAHTLSLSRCPNCRARLSENTQCPRCGTDLSLSLQIVHEANKLERMAVAHMLTGEWSLAKTALVSVQRLHHSAFSRQLLAFVDHQLMIVSKSVEDESLSNKSVVENVGLTALDLAEVERYG